MTIKDISESEFVNILYNHLTPSSPIQSFENLYGRQAQLRQIEQALYSPGRHIFIYGDRGVGKTSLAQTAAFSHQSADNEPIIKSCEKDTTFFNIIKSICESIVQNPMKKNTTKVHKGKMGFSGLSYEMQKTITNGVVPEISEMNTALAAIKFLTEKHSEKTLVVIDEFDLIQQEEERIHFADFIKQLGDQVVKIQFIFCGIAESLDELLCAHNSCYRYIENIELPRLYWNARWDIIDSTATALGVKIDDNLRFRIAAISDGFPHYIHLVCEKLFWELFDDPEPCPTVKKHHYSNAVTSAIKGIQQQLRMAYDKATLKNTDDYHEVLWSVADHADLMRRYGDIYKSYLRIMKEKNSLPLDKSKFSSRMNSLKSKACEYILVSKKRGWYEFNENIVRGYVRLRAEEQGIPLATEYTPGEDLHKPEIRNIIKPIKI